MIDPSVKQKAVSADVRVCAPCSLVVELQTRSVCGSQDSLFWNNLIDDYQRLVSAKADVFVFACDRSIYEVLRGGRRDNRGRKAAVRPEEARELMPDPDGLSTEPSADVRAIDSARFGQLHYLGCRTGTNPAVERIVRKGF